MENQSRIDVSFGAGKHANIIVSGVDERHASHLNDWGLFRGFCRHDTIAKIHYLVAADVKKMTFGLNLGW